MVRADMATVAISAELEFAGACSAGGLVGWGGRALERSGGEAEGMACYARIGAQR